MKKIIYFIIFVLLAGCSPKPMLVKNVTPEQNAMDNAECNLEAQKATQAQTNDLMFLVYKDQAMANCLQAKGYTYQTPLTPEQQAVSDKYKAAVATMVAKDKVNSDYVENTCLPLGDKEFLECVAPINLKRKTYQVFPDLYDKLLSERKEYEGMLLRKDINRLQYKAEIKKLYENYLDRSNKRSNADIMNATYTGNPNL